MAKRGGGFPGGAMPGNMNNMMKQVQKMQKDMEKMQAELGEKRAAAEQRRAGIKTDAGVASYQWVVYKPRVLQGIRHFHDPVRIQNGVGTKSMATRRFHRIQAHTGLEPLAVFIDQGDQDNRGVANVRGQLDHIVIGLLSRGIQNLEAAKVIDPKLLIRVGGV